MYQVESSGALLERGGRARFRKLRVSRNVVLLGITSMLTDVSSEMVSTILPLYVFFALGGSPLAVGVVDGIYQGATALVRVGGGFFADRFRRYKEVAAAGYGISAVARLGLLAAGGVGGVGAAVVADRIGKGIRTAPRDALISLSSTRAGLATSFGVHRALDTAGAFLGPLIAFGLLLLAPGEYDAVFVVSLCFAILGLAVLLLFVEKRRGRAETDEKPALRDAVRLLKRPGFAPLVAVAAVLGLATLSDGLLYLGLQRRLDFEPAFVPLLFVGTAAAYMLFAIPVGRLADRVGRKRVFIAGYALLPPVYATLLLPSIGVPELVLCLLLLGLWYAATDGVLMALASSMLPENLQASGLALVVTATSLTRLLASVLFGALWTVMGIEGAALVFAAILLVALPAAALVLARSKEAPAGA